MSALISGRDLIEIAIEAETRGIAFYNCLAERMPSPAARHLFASMEEEEKEHLKDLQVLLEEAEGYEPTEDYPESYYDYLRALLNDWPLPDQDACAQMVSASENAAEACPLGSAFEKQVILLLHEMRRWVPEDQHGTVQKLLEGEYEHVKHLHALEQEAYA